MIAGVPTKVHLFQMRACFSGACFVQAHVRETQQAFLEGHVAAFEFFGGVFGLIRYDNLGSAVKRVLQRPPPGRDRPVRGAALALPLRVELHPCGQGGRAREGRDRGRRRPVPPHLPGAVPEVGSLAELNDLLLPRASRTCGARSAAGARPSVRRSVTSSTCSAPCRRRRSTQRSTRRRGWTASRWPRSGRTSTRCRSGSPASESPPGSAPVRSCSSTTDRKSPGTSGCTGSSAPPRNWTTTSSCSSSSRAHCPLARAQTRARRLAGLLR